MNGLRFLVLDLVAGLVAVLPSAALGQAVPDHMSRPVVPSSCSAIAFGLPTLGGCHTTFFDGLWRDSERRHALPLS